jgi:hypothetical protein
VSDSAAVSAARGRKARAMLRFPSPSSVRQQQHDGNSFASGGPMARRRTDRRHTAVQRSWPALGHQRLGTHAARLEILRPSNARSLMGQLPIDRTVTGGQKRKEVPNGTCARRITPPTLSVVSHRATARRPPRGASSYGPSSCRTSTPSSCRDACPISPWVRQPIARPAQDPDHACR